MAAVTKLPRAQGLKVINRNLEVKTISFACRGKAARLGGPSSSHPEGHSPLNRVKLIFQLFFEVFHLPHLSLRGKVEE